MELDHDTCYSALRSRDRRFDGTFFIGVTSTGIYCRPVCPARTPQRPNCTFFSCAAAAEEAGFRPCLRCRPETAPGTAAWRGTAATVGRALRLIEEGALDAGSVEDLAARLGIGGRQLRRLFAEQIGASPRAVARTRRVHFARQLIDDTDLPFGRIALAAGFGTVRRFNAAIRATFHRTPRELRQRRTAGDTAGREGGLELTLAYRAPYDWQSIADFLAARAIPGLEEIVGGGQGTNAPPVYRRAVACSDGAGVIELRPSADRDALLLRIPAVCVGQAQELATRTRRLFDLDADPARIAAQLQQDPLLRPLLKRRPGLRIPGAWDRFELAVRAVLGQQVSVAGATTLCGRLVRAAGATASPDKAKQAGDAEAESAAAAGLCRLFPSPARLADADLRGLGLTGARIATITALAHAVRDTPDLLEPVRDPAETRRRLCALPGIGEWTAQYICLRALGDPDAFPAGDLGLRRALASDLELQDRDALPALATVIDRAAAWRPWRAYAVMHLWLAQPTRRRKSS